MTCIIKLLNNTPKSICKLGLKKSGMSIIIKKNTAFRTGHFSIGGKMYVYPKYQI